MSDEHDQGHLHHPNELLMPPEVIGDPEAGEVMRAWIVNGGLSVSLHPSALGAVEVWGMLLVDVARHVSRAYEDMGEGTYAANLEQIQGMMDAEFARPTDLGTTERMRKS
jgi:hypothetical protein